MNKLVHEYNITYHHSIGKNPVDADHFTLTKEFETNPKATKFKVDDRVRITKYKSIFREGYTKSWRRTMFVIGSVLKINSWAYKIKDLNREKIIENFYEKELLLSKLRMSYYPEPDIHIRVKVKIVLDLSNYVT